MGSLLERTRIVNRLIQNSSSRSVDFTELAVVMSEVSRGAVFVIAKNGKLLGHSLERLSDDPDDLAEPLETGFLPREANDSLLRVFDTVAGLPAAGTLEVFADESMGGSPSSVITMVPVYGGGERLATIALVDDASPHGDDDLVIAEYCATVVGMEILRSRSDRHDEEARKRNAVQMALDTLSYSEQEAVEHIFDELSGDEGLLVASRIADRVGITRSVIVNALRKFESAGVIESRSLGMKGTYIRVLNDKLFDELERLRAR